MNVVPIIHYHERMADDAFEVHSALLRAELNNQALAANPIFQRFRKQAFDLFISAFDACDEPPQRLNKVRAGNTFGEVPGPDHEREVTR